ncbi:unnamed protein product, partial [Aureobasidium uvarum]
VWSKVAGVNYEIFYVRYIDWSSCQITHPKDTRFVTTPLLLMDFVLTAGLPWPTILHTIVLAELMVVTGFVGALVKSRYKASGPSAPSQCSSSSRTSQLKAASTPNTSVQTSTKRISSVESLTFVIWLYYPICWRVSEGANIISPDSEAVFYGILDFLAKPCFSIALIVGHWNINPGRMGLRLRDYDDEEPAYFGPKNGAEAAKERGRAGNGIDGVA